MSRELELKFARFVWTKFTHISLKDSSIGDDMPAFLFARILYW